MISFIGLLPVTCIGETAKQRLHWFHFTLFSLRNCEKSNKNFKWLLHADNSTFIAGVGKKLFCYKSKMNSMVVNWHFTITAIFNYMSNKITYQNFLSFFSKKIQL